MAAGTKFQIDIGDNADMAGDRVLRLERWGLPHGYDEREWACASEQELIEVIRSLAYEHSAILFIEIGDKVMGINANEGRFSVGLQFNEDTAFDLLGSIALSGSIPFVLGGQLVPVPRRHLVSLDQAQQVGLDFFRTGSIDVTGTCWSRQGPGDAWDET
jgi:hypothetical protein